MTSVTLSRGGVRQPHFPVHGRATALEELVVDDQIRGLAADLGVGVLQPRVILTNLELTAPLRDLFPAIPAGDVEDVIGAPLAAVEGAAADLPFGLRAGNWRAV